ncbi:MAG: inositol monophosphatase family protein [Planctomycetota bacterium]
MDTEFGDLDETLLVAESAAREAGALLMSYFGKLDAERLERKSSARDLVTEADLASERVLVSTLRERFPGHAIEAEEEVRDAPDDARPRWFLDPLDGTTNFVHQLPAFCVSLGLVAPSGVPLVGVVHAPLLGETFVARRGGGAWCLGPGDRRVRLAISRTTSLSEAVVATGFPYRRNELVNNNFTNLKNVFLEVRGLRRFGAAALDLAWVAAGRLDAYWEQHVAPHDVAAGALLVREAGGVVEDLDGGDHWLRAGHLVASNRALVDALQERVSTAG